MTKNEQIKQTLMETKLRRKSQDLKVYELKINIHHFSKENAIFLDSLFVQTKWIQNDIIASGNIFDYDYKSNRIIKNFDKNGNLVERKLNINTGIHQVIIRRIQQDVTNLAKKKAKGSKIGKLKFRRNCATIPLRTGQLKVVNSKTISIPHFRKLKVYGLEQFINLPEFEIANANLIRKATGFYIKVSILTPKSSSIRAKTNRTVGLDFGIKDNITTSDGEKFNCSVQESEKLKFLQRKLSKKTKNSKRYHKCLNQIKKEYEHLVNKKNDDSNLLLSYLLKKYDVIYFQDEPISSWKKFNRNFAKNIQHSYLGRIKARLVSLTSSGKTFEISRWKPSTKFCPQCGALNDGIRLSDRIYRCDCGYQFDRDIHAAKNVKLFGSTKRAECLEQASVETLTSAASESNSDVVS